MALGRVHFECNHYYCITFATPFCQTEARGVGNLSIRQPSVPCSMSTQPLLQRSTPSKRIALPVRVEPKVFFACVAAAFEQGHHAWRGLLGLTLPLCQRFRNERTFLSWLNFTVVLSGAFTSLVVQKMGSGPHICLSMFRTVSRASQFWRQGLSILLGLFETALMLADRSGGSQPGYSPWWLWPS